MVAREFVSDPGDLFLLCICRDRAWCLRHSAAEWPLLKFTTVNINEKSSRLHFVQYILQYFSWKCIPSNTSIDFSMDFKQNVSQRLTQASLDFRCLPDASRCLPGPPQMPRICFQMLHTENRKTLHWREFLENCWKILNWNGNQWLEWLEWLGWLELLGWLGWLEWLEWFGKLGLVRT